MPDPGVAAAIATLREGGRRALLAVCGDRQRGLAAIEQAIRSWPSAGVVRAPGGGPGRGQGVLAPAMVLGREFDAVVYDAWAGFDPDLFGALAGCVRGGGVVLLCCPDLASWPIFRDPQRARVDVHPFTGRPREDPYLGRLARLVAGSAEVIRLSADVDALPQLEPPKPMPQLRLLPSQQRAVEAVVHVVQGQRRRPVVLQADRGRGKSAALGIAAARLLRAGGVRIAVTAARARAASGVFRHAALELGMQAIDGGPLESAGGRLEFVDVPRLLIDGESHDLVLVDEAAALPMAVLERLLIRFPRLAFATTVHGYEGSGRGFALHFRRLLERHTRGWKEPLLDQPIRWAEQDPCEGFVNRALLLNAVVDCPAPGRTLPAAAYTMIPTASLAKDESRLVAVFGLLVQAHYRTRPFDLRQLVDGPSIELAVATVADRVVAVALLSREGGLPAGLAAEVASGRRRPRGHLLPESLAAHLGLASAAGLSARRVVRIAVAPEWQGRGIGSRLLQFVAEHARASGADYLGTSFSLGPGLLRFWQRAGYRAAWLGHRTSAAAAARPLLMVRKISSAGADICREACARLADSLPLRLAGAYSDLDADTVIGLLHGRQVEVSTADLDTARAFAGRGITFEAAFAALWRVAPLVVAISSTGEGRRRQHAVVEVVMRQRDPAECAASLGYPGRRQLIDDLAEAFRWAIECDGLVR